LSADLPAVWTQLIPLDAAGTSTNGYVGRGSAPAILDS
jgi:hypothetical protein